MFDLPRLEEGEYINRPLRFNGQHYEWWKARMQDFIMGHDPELWDIICDGSHSPIDICVTSVAIDTKIKNEQNDTDGEVVQKDIKAKNILISSLGSEEYNLIAHCKTPKDIWKALQNTYEGINIAKQSRIKMLTTEYEFFKMKDGDSIFDMYARFSLIINELRSLVCTIIESEYLANLTLDELIYDHETYELKNKDEENKKRRRKKRNVTNDEDKNNPGNEESELTLITEELSKTGCCNRNAQEGKEKNQEDTLDRSEDENDAGEASSIDIDGKASQYDSFLALVAKSEDDDDDEVISLANVLTDAYHSLVYEKNTLNKEAGVLEQARDDMTVTIMDLREQVEELSRDNARLNNQMKKWINMPWRKQEGEGNKTHLEIESKLEKARMSLTDEVDKNRLLQKELKQVKTELEKSLIWTLPLDKTVATRNGDDRK
ncbi:uncharacterized protein LOC132624344 [Lycium barbarum]|uniref:uncharacterized protein LOC132624344 n=1 Tax=Lycium barbarum TaxID=112863 RepID=UPI00293ED8C8|nr:uncharacterized protein LOC132624344 [Lycium barbarum]